MGCIWREQWVLSTKLSRRCMPSLVDALASLSLSHYLAKERKDMSMSFFSLYIYFLKIIE